jgi:hypothetical protein
MGRCSEMTKEECEQKAIEYMNQTGGCNRYFDFAELGMLYVSIGHAGNLITHWIEDIVSIDYLKKYEYNVDNWK